jgi:hypothetical protein
MFCVSQNSFPDWVLRNVWQAPAAAAEPDLTAWRAWILARVL